MSEQFGFLYNKENCIQCLGCEIACKTWRNVELGVRWRRVDNIWHGRYPEVKNSSASIACLHCAYPACVESCPEEAIFKRDEDGIVEVDEEKCTGCQICLEACPFGVPQFGSDGKMQKCDMCVNELDLTTDSPPCVKTCPTKALVFGKMNEQEKLSAEASTKHLIVLSRTQAIPGGMHGQAGDD